VGDLFVADTAANRVRKVSVGTITTVAGSGVAGFGGDNGPATAAMLRTPSRLAVDAAGNLYIADSANNVIRKVTAGTGMITRFAGNTGGAFWGDDGPATAASVNWPMGLAVNADGDRGRIVQLVGLGQLPARVGLQIQTEHVAVHAAGEPEPLPVEVRLVQVGPTG
jgi:hypothetical protein